VARQPTHHLYLDDSGTKEYAPRYATRGGGATPYFVFGGILVRTDVSARLDYEFRQVKRKYFGREDVEIKANWLRRRDQRGRRYLDRYPISEHQLVEFVDCTYDLIVATPCDLYACAVNKQETEQKYANPWYAPALAYEFLLQRVAIDMQERGGFVHVTVDDMSGATPKMRAHKVNLGRHDERLTTQGSPLQQGISFDGVGGLTFRDSAADGRLQLADLVAYAVYRQFVEYGVDWEKEASRLPTYKYFSTLVSKFKQDAEGRVQGYGVVKFPMNRRVKWRVRQQDK